MAVARSPLRNEHRRPRESSPAIAALTAVLALAVAVAAADVLTGPEASVRSWDRPHDVATLASAAGAMWAGESATDSLLRLDLDTGRATSRLTVGSQARALEHRLWVLDGGHRRLAVVDPASGVVTQRVTLATPDGEPYKGFDAFPSGRSVWVTDSFGAALLDRASLAHRKRVSVADDGTQVAGWAPAGTVVWLVRGDGRIERFDGSGGRRTLKLPPVVAGSSPRILADEHGVAVLGADGAIVGLDPDSGRTRWRTRLPRPPAAAAFAGSLLAVASQHPAEPHDRLIIVSRDDGRRLAAVDLPVIGASSMTVAGSRVWLAAPGGHVVSVRLPEP